MKKTVNINLNSVSFIIDDDAFEVLQSYLNKIEGYFKNSESQKEIMMDIESRIAELLGNKISDRKHIVNLEDVQAIIAVMGNPEDYSDGQAQQNAPNEEYTAPKTRPMFGKKIYRDADQRVLGGVCSGLSYYLGIDRVWVRLLFVLIFLLGFGTSFLVYIIMWIIVPKAVTASEKLEMRGEPVDFNNIGKAVQEEMEEVKKKFNDYKYEYKHHYKWDFPHRKHYWKQEFKETGNSIANTLGRLFRGIIGLILLIFGVSFISLFLASFFWDASYININDVALNQEQVDQLVSYIFTDSSQLTWVWYGIYGILGILAVWFLFSAVKLLFDLRMRTRWISLSFFILFLACTICLCIPLSSLIHAFSHKEQSTKVDTLKATTSKNLYLVQMPGQDKNLENKGHINNYEFIIDVHQMKLGYVPNISISESTDSVPHLSIVKEARGYDKATAQKNMNHINFYYYQSNDTLYLDTYGMIEAPFRKQKVNLELKMPKGYKVTYDEQVQDIYSIDVERNTSVEKEQQVHAF